MTDEKKEPFCPNCVVSDDTIEKLKDSGQNNKVEYESKKHKKEQERVVRAKTAKAKKIIIWIVVLIATGGLIFTGIKYLAGHQQEGEKAIVYYSPTCSCCKEYIVYLRSKGFNVDARSTDNMLAIKEQYNIPSNVESCHTSIIGGYFIEGHVPQQFIEKLIAEKPAISGIALPGMPQGSPGMPGFKSGESQIYTVNKGSVSNFATW